MLVIVLCCSSASFGSVTVKILSLPDVPEVPEVSEVLEVSDEPEVSDFSEFVSSIGLASSGMNISYSVSVML